MINKTVLTEGVHLVASNEDTEYGCGEFEYQYHVPLSVSRPSLRLDRVMINTDHDGPDGESFSLTLTEAMARRLAFDLARVLGDSD